MLKILTVPNPTLRKKSKPVKVFDKKLGKFIGELNDALVNKQDPPGVGLSAIQVGKPWRIFSTFLPKDSNEDRPKSSKRFLLTTFVNPTIVANSKKLTLGPKPKDPILEGCLSIPGIYGPVKRHEWVKLKWQIADLPAQAGGKWHTDKFSGFTARVIQHEMNHLDGILFPDLTLKQKLPLYEERKGKLQRIELTVA